MLKIVHFKCRRVACIFDENLLSMFRLFYGVFQQGSRFTCKWLQYMYMYILLVEVEFRNCECQMVKFVKTNSCTDQSGQIIVEVTFTLWSIYMWVMCSIYIWGDKIRWNWVYTLHDQSKKLSLLAELLKEIYNFDVNALMHWRLKFNNYKKLYYSL